MKKVEDYSILFAGSLRELGILVRGFFHLNEGYIPLGAPFYSDGPKREEELLNRDGSLGKVAPRWQQAVVKYEN